MGAIVKTSSKSKVSIFVEFGLQLLGDILVEKRYNPESKEDVAKLNPFFELVLNALRLKYEKVLNSCKYKSNLLCLDYNAFFACSRYVAQVSVAINYE